MSYNSFLGALPRLSSVYPMNYFPPPAQGGILGKKKQAMPFTIRVSGSVPAGKRTSIGINIPIDFCCEKILFPRHNSADDKIGIRDSLSGDWISYLPGSKFFSGSSPLIPMSELVDADGFLVMHKPVYFASNVLLEFSVLSDIGVKNFEVILIGHRLEGEEALLWSRPSGPVWILSHHNFAKDKHSQSDVLRFPKLPYTFGLHKMSLGYSDCGPDPEICNFRSFTTNGIDINIDCLESKRQLSNTFIPDYCLKHLDFKGIPINSLAIDFRQEPIKNLSMHSTSPELYILLHGERL